MPAISSPSRLQSPQRPPISISYLPPDRLKPDPANARQHSAKQIRQIADSIAAFGFNVPILVDVDLNVIAGHGRLLACKRLGWSEVPTIRLEHLSETQRRAFMIADNRLTEIATWDDRLLAGQLKELSEIDLSFAIETTGFAIPQIDLMIASLSGPAMVADEKPLSCVSGPPVTRAGDLWALARHHVLCGDATVPTTYDELLGSEEVALIFTDPPFNVRIDGHVSGLGGVRHREFAMAAGEMSVAAFTGFLETALRSAARKSRSGALVYVCMDWRHIPELQAAASACDLEMVNLCIWIKPNGGMGSFYRSQHELIFVYKNGKGPHVNNVQLGRHGRNRTNVWPYSASPGFGRAGEEGPLGSLHPTIKPVQMIADALLDGSGRSDIVLDPFLGSGATLMAAERTGRRCFGLELDPLYVDLIIRRWQAYTGDVARCLLTGASFDEIAADRAPVTDAVTP